MKIIPLFGFLFFFWQPCSLLSQSLGERDSNLLSQIKIDYYSSRMNDLDLPLEERIVYSDSAVNMARKLGKDKERLEFLYTQAFFYEGIGNSQRSLEIWEEVKRDVEILLQKEGEERDTWRKIYFKTLYRLGRGTHNLGLYKESSNYFYDLLAFNNDEDLNVTLLSYANLCVLFLNTNQLKIAVEYRDKCRNLVNEYGISKFDQNAMFQYYNTYAGVSYKEKEYEEAIVYLNKALLYVDSLGQTEVDYSRTKKSVLQSVYYNMANVYMDLGQMEMAKQSLLKILKGLEETQEVSYLHAQVLLNLGYSFLQEKDYQQSLRYYRRSETMAKQLNARNVLSTIYQELSQLYYEIGNVQSAYEYLSRGYSLRDSVLNESNMEQVRIMSNQYEREKAVLEKNNLYQELELARKELANKHMVLVSVFFILLFFIFVFIVVLKKMIQKRQENMVLDQALKENKVESEKEFQENITKVNQEVEQKNRELTSTALLLVRANELISALKSLVKKLNSPHPYADEKQIISEMTSMLQSYNMEQGWQEFKTYFEQVHPRFFKNLTCEFPAVTPSEQRTCALLVLNLSTKEISDITHRSIRTVEASMYQIRKKLNIPANEKTALFLQKFL